MKTDILTLVSNLKELSTTFEDYDLLLEVLEHLTSIMVTRNEKNKYGDSYKATGLIGILTQINHKAAILKNVIYNKDNQLIRYSGYQIATQSVIDGRLSGKGPGEHLSDLINYSLFALIEILKLSKEDKNVEL